MTSIIVTVNPTEIFFFLPNILEIETLKADTEESDGVSSTQTTVGSDSVKVTENLYKWKRRNVLFGQYRS